MCPNKAEKKYPKEKLHRVRVPEILNTGFHCRLPAPSWMPSCYRIVITVL